MFPDVPENFHKQAVLEKRMSNIPRSSANVIINFASSRGICQEANTSNRARAHSDSAYGSTTLSISRYVHTSFEAPMPAFPEVERRGERDEATVVKMMIISGKLSATAAQLPRHGVTRASTGHAVRRLRVFLLRCRPSLLIEYCCPL